MFHFRRDSGNLIFDAALVDAEWVDTASKPWSCGLPWESFSSDGSATWQIFSQQLPRLLQDVLKTDRELKQHLIVESDQTHAWLLSYAAGSAAAIAHYGEFVQPKRRKAY